MGPHLTVIDETTGAFMDKFDGIFDGQNMIFSGSIRHIDNGRKGRGFAASGRSCNNDQPSGQSSQFGNDRREAKLFCGHDFAWNFPKYRRNPVFLRKKVGPVPGQPRNLITEIDITGFLILLDFLFRRDFIQHGLELIIVERLEFDPFQLTPNPQHRLLPGNKVEVRSPLVVHQFKECIDFSHGLLPIGCMERTWVRVTGVALASSKSNGNIMFDYVFFNTLTLVSSWSRAFEASTPISSKRLCPSRMDRI